MKKLILIITILIAFTINAQEKDKGRSPFSNLELIMSDWGGDLYASTNVELYGLNNVALRVLSGRYVLGHTGAQIEAILDRVDSVETALNFFDATSSIQGQIDLKAPLASPTFTGQVTTAGIKVLTHTITSDSTLAASLMYGGVFYVTGAYTVTLPAVAVGMSATFITVGANAVSVDVNGSDLQYLDGTALADGDKATNTSTTGDMIVFTYYSADGWYSASNGWSDGN